MPASGREVKASQVVLGPSVPSQPGWRPAAALAERKLSCTLAKKAAEAAAGSMMPAAPSGVESVLCAQQRSIIGQPEVQWTGNLE